MPDRQYIIDIILRAKDETARAFAEATGNMEAYNAAMKAQEADAAKASGRNQQYVRELNERQKTEQKLINTLNEARLRNTDTAESLLKLESAHKRVVKAEAENDPRKRIVALRGVQVAENELIKALQKEDQEGKKLNAGLATAHANRMSQQAAELARLRQTGIERQRDWEKEQEVYKNRQAEEKAWRDLATGLNAETEKSKTASMRRLDQEDAADARKRSQRRVNEQREIDQMARAQIRAEEQRINKVESITQRTRGPARILARTDVSHLQEAKATRELAAARDHLLMLDVPIQEAESRIHAVRQNALRDYGFENQAARDLAKVNKDQAEAYRMVENAVRKVSTARRASRSGAGPRSIDEDTARMAETKIGPPQGVGGGGFGATLNSIKQQMADLDTTTSGFSGHLRGAFGFAAVALIQPLAALILGLVGTMGALASAAIAAGTAIGVTFVAAIAQGIPVIGIFAAAMQRLQSVFGYVSTVMGQAQQQFQAQFQVAQQNKMGINQVAIAVHQYSDALFAAQQAVRNISVAEHSYQDALYAQRQAVYQVQVAQLGLLVARRDSTRQLQQLIFQETNARLAAEASSLAIVNSQKALQQAIATGGDVQQAQLQLSQAHAQHQQSVASAQQAITDAAPGSVARQQIQQTVVAGQQGVQQARRAVVDANFALQQAQVGIVQARRAVIDAQFQVAQARAAIIQAQQAAAGYNVGTAAQLAWLRATMSRTELALANNIKNILGLFQSLPGHVARFRVVTDAIVQPFVLATNRIFKLLTDPRMFAALLNLSRSMGRAMNTIINTIFSNQSVNNFLKIVGAAAANMKPLGEIISNIFRGLQAIVIASLPFVHQFAGFIAALTRQFADWAASTRGQNWLKSFFDIAFRSLESFINLGVAVVRLFAAIIGPGGGAQAGIKVLQGWTTWINHATDAINRAHGPTRGLKTLWDSIGPTLHFLGVIIGAVVRGLLQLGGTAQGRNALKGLGDILAHVVIPGMVQGFIWVGKFFGKIMDFFRHHPEMEKLAKDLIAIGIATNIMGKAFGLIFGPMAAVIGGIGKLPILIKGLKDALEGLNLLELFGNPVVLAIAAVVAAIVGISAATGNLGRLWNTLKAPFVAFWDEIRKPLQKLGKDFLYFINSILSPFGVHFKSIGDFIKRSWGGVLDFFKGLWSTMGHIFGRVVGDMIKVFSGFFRLLGDLFHGHIGKVFGDAWKIGKAILDGLFTIVTAVPKLIIKFVGKIIETILHWGPVKHFIEIAGKMISGLVTGLWDGVKAVVGFFGMLGEKIVDAVVNGIKAVAHKIMDVINTVLKPVKAIFDAIFGDSHNADRVLTRHRAENRASPFGGGQGVRLGRAQGGPIPGYGGGDIVSARLEPGEHVLTKEEVRSAGGHGPIFALRRSLGGGGQGGPSGYQHGGQVDEHQSQTAYSLFSLGLQNPRGQTTQGVTGVLGSILANLNVFTSAARKDWGNFWKAFNKDTQSNFKDHQKIWTNSFDFLTKTVSSFWNRTNDRVQKSLDILKNNFKNAYKIFDTDTFNAFWYVQHAANASLKAFQAPPVKVDLGAPPKFSGGGMVGQIGERGRDAVHALVGRGEAILNYAHQKVVDPALRKMYGPTFGLREMFNRVRGEHAGGGGYAGGGYVFPFSGSGWSWSRTDQGVDFGGNSPIGAIGDATVTYSNPNDGWYSPAPAFMVYRLTSGPDQGKYIYIAEHIANMAPAGANIKAGHALAQMTGGIEMGWAAGPQGHQIVLPMGSDHLTAAGEDFHRFLVGLTHGQILGGGRFGGGGAQAVWKEIKEQTVKGKGVMADVLRKAIKKITDAANKYGEKKAGSAGGGGIPNIGGGPVPSQIAAAAKQLGFNKIAIAGLIGNAFQESSLNPGLDDGTALGLWQWDKAAGEAAQLIQFAAANHKPWQSVALQVALLAHQIGHSGIAAMNASKTPAEAALWFMNNFEKPGIPMAQHRIDAANSAFAAGYARGGFAGEGAPVGILGHVGEWVLNRGQQGKLANWLGTSIGGLRNSLGLRRGGTQQFREGGEIAGYATGGTPLPHVYNPYSGGEVGERYIPRNRPYLPTVDPKTGVIDVSNINLGTPGFDIQAINQYNAAQAIIIEKIEKNKKGLTKGIKQFLDNFNKIGGDSGLFALANQAIQDWVNQQGALVQLAAAGYHLVNNSIKRLRGGPQTAIQAAQTDLRVTNAEIDRLSRLQREEVIAMRAINAELRRLPRTTANLPRIQQLLGARKQMVDNLNTTDQSLAQAYSDRYQKATAKFQAQTDAALRGGGTVTGGQIGRLTEGTRPGTSPGNLTNAVRDLHNVLGKVGPNIALGIAQMSQGIAQTLGRTGDLGIADQAVINAAQRQHKVLQERYEEAAKRARTDPRWRTVADDLLSQLESSVQQVVQAQATALQDAISRVDTQTQMRNAAYQLADTLAQAQAAMSNVAGPANQYAAQAQQIATSQARTGFLRDQLTQYGQLYQQAVAQGNVGAQNTLTQTMDDLTAQIQQSVLATQQLVTANRQLAVTILNAQTQASSSFFSAAQGIAQTLGAITGSLNLPALITYAREAGRALITQGQQAVQNILQALAPDPTTGQYAFGANQAQATGFLNQLIDAFQKGPQTFADTLAQIAPALAQFEAGLPADQQTLFQNLIQSLIDNTTAQVDNTQQLQQLNATTNQQQFTSSEWTMFRNAIFNGLGGLLPQYAMTVPAMDTGGYLSSSGLLYGHKDEVILPARVNRDVPLRDRHIESHVHLTSPTEVADPVYLSNRVAWTINHDPNNR